MDNATVQTQTFNKHDNTTNDIIITNKQFIAAVTQSFEKCAKPSELTFFHGHACVYTKLKHLGKKMIQTNPSKFDKKLLLCYSLEDSYTRPCTKETFPKSPERHPTCSSHFYPLQVYGETHSA